MTKISIDYRRSLGKKHRVYNKMSIAPVNKNNVQVGLPKNMVPNSGWFNRNRTKFEDW